MGSSHEPVERAKEPGATGARFPIGTCLLLGGIAAFVGAAAMIDNVISLINVDALPPIPKAAYFLAVGAVALSWVGVAALTSALLLLLVSSMRRRDDVTWNHDL